MTIDFPAVKPASLMALPELTQGTDYTLQGIQQYKAFIQSQQFLGVKALPPQGSN